ncbi:kinesin, motor region protein [Mucor ambiguus]|uniref:Kinesin-like protein n=1 Tax=Mucor ambiguus TaxID=91626 RepID=A0A0C9MS23_9FUNG|nr:kinesin, motor region protein [Mucor ambiguus]
MALTTVRVALRVRPFNEKELKETHQTDNLITFVPGQPQQISIDQDRRHFTFDYVYPSHKSQADVYQSCIQPLFDQFVNGYNATILAYGQTGSGKTYSMGTSTTADFSSEHVGIVPRFADNLFDWIKCQQNKPDNNTQYSVEVSFLELYNEDIIDLLSVNNKNASITIRENANGNITWSGVQEERIQGAADLLSCLSRGSTARTTASTDMNASSSRSHAIFSVSLTQHMNVSVENNDTIAKTLQSKFHFVDLAGSERLKKTNAVGDRAKEGISINSGLLALGNVISALGDESRRQQQHIPYRNSKLTRLLQDSLGGNSQTLMLACVSPADTNANETLSTLKYANRAKNITNTVVLNQQQSLTDTLKEEIAHLKEEIRINDAFMKEVHVELDDLRAKNTALESFIYCNNNNGLPDSAQGTGMDETGKLSSLMARSQQQPQTATTKTSPATSVINTSTDLMEDDQVTLVGSSMDDTMHVSTSTKRKRKSTSSSNHVRKRVAATAAATTENDQNSLLSSLDKHKHRMKKEYLFIKQIKNQPDLTSDPNKITKLINMFLSSIREQKQLVQLVEQSSKQQPQTATRKPLLPPSSIPISKRRELDQSKPSLIKQPTAISLLNTTSATLTDTLMLEHQTMSSQLKQIMAAIKKAMVLTNNPSTSLSQLKPILNRAALIYTQHSNSTKITHSSSSTNSNNNSTATAKSSKASNGSTRNQNRSSASGGSDKRQSSITNKKRVNIEDVRAEIKRIMAFEHIKLHPICLEMLNSLKQQKIKLMREQKDLLKERHDMLKEFYKDEFSEQQQKQQYMDERIDTITVQVDLLTEHIQLLSSTTKSTLSSSNNKNNHSLIEILKHLKEGDLRALILLIIQQDLASFNLQSQISQHTTEALYRFQQGMVQLRRTNDEINNQILTDLLRSPIRCLSNGLLLISGK